MLRLLANSRFRTKLILAIMAGLLLIAGVLLGFNHFEYSRTASIPLARFIPDSAHAALIVTDFADVWKEVSQSAVATVAVPGLRGKKNIADCIAAVLDETGGGLKSHSEAVRRTVTRVGEERFLSLCGREAFASVEFQPGNPSPLIVVGTRVGFTDFLGRIFLGSVLEAATGKEGQSTVIAGGTFRKVNLGPGKEGANQKEWLVGFLGSVLLVSNEESFLRRSITAALTEEGAASRATVRTLVEKKAGKAPAVGAIAFSELPHDCSWRTETLSFLESVPTRELLHFLSAPALKTVSAELHFSKDSSRMLLDVELCPKLLEERQARFLTIPFKEPLESPSLVPESAFLCVVSRVTPADSWDFITATARERDRAAYPKQVGDILKAMYAEADRILLMPLEKSGKHTELLSALGGEILFAASRENLAWGSEERVSIGGSIIVRVIDEQKVLSVLDGLETWNLTDSHGRPQLIREKHRGVDVRLLKLAFQKYGRGFTPSYAVVNGWLVFSSSLAFVHDVIDVVLDGPKAAPTNLVQYDLISGERASSGSWCMLVDFRGLRDALQEARGAIAEVQSDNIDRVAVRAKIVAREESALELAGQSQLVAEWRRYREALSSGGYVAPSQALQRLLEKVDTLVMEEVENERRRAEQTLLDFVYRLSPLRALSISVKTSAPTVTLTLAVSGRATARRNY